MRSSTTWEKEEEQRRNQKSPTTPNGDQVAASIRLFGPSLPTQKRDFGPQLKDSCHPCEGLIFENHFSQICRSQAN